MNDYILQAKKAADFLREKIKASPKILIMAGTGLGELSGSVICDTVIDYAKIPGFPETTVESHAGELVFGELKGKPVVIMKGRFHLYRVIHLIR
jgi:purine-nucleoside phosphorylase